MTPHFLVPTVPRRNVFPGALRPLLLTLLATGCGTSVPADDPGEPPLAECTADLDGVMSFDEMPVVTGIEVRYVRNLPGAPVEVDVEGELATEGGRLWDFSDGPADVGATLVLQEPGELTASDLFPDATYAAPMLIESPDLMGWFRVDDGDEPTLSMLGMATRDGVDPASRTVVVYDEPLVLYRYPFGVGDAWEQTVTYRDALAYGIPNQGVEHYHVEVDARGTARLPGGVEVSDVLRVRVQVDQTLALAAGGHTQTFHQLLWVRPCFGELARVVSADPDFATVDEFRRYYP